MARFSCLVNMCSGVFLRILARSAAVLMMGSGGVCSIFVVVSGLVGVLVFFMFLVFLVRASMEPEGSLVSFNHPISFWLKLLIAQV